MVAKHFRTVYEIMISFKVIKLYHFDLLKPCNAIEVPGQIVRARRHFAWDNISQRSLKARKVNQRQVQTGNTLSLRSANQ